MTLISELLADHSVALEFVRELASTACEWGCIADHPDEQPCIHCRAAKWLDATKQAELEREVARLREAVVLLAECMGAHLSDRVTAARLGALLVREDKVTP